jgi:hypothetical protein
MNLSFEVQIERLEVVKCETFAGLLRRWLTKLWRLIQQRRK